MKQENYYLKAWRPEIETPNPSDIIFESPYRRKGNAERIAREHLRNELAIELFEIVRHEKDGISFKKLVSIWKERPEHFRTTLGEVLKLKEKMKGNGQTT